MGFEHLLNEFLVVNLISNHGTPVSGWEGFWCCLIYKQQSRRQQVNWIILGGFFGSLLREILSALSCWVLWLFFTARKTEGMNFNPLNPQVCVLIEYLSFNGLWSQLEYSVNFTMFLFKWKDKDRHNLQAHTHKKMVILRPCLCPMHIPLVIIPIYIFCLVDKRMHT